MQNLWAQGGLVRRHAPRATISLLILGLCLALLRHRLAAFDAGAMALAFQAVTVGQWLAALAAVALSYAAIGQYDRLILRHLCQPHDGAEARRAGITALALSQTVGLGVLSGALVRWRMLPGISFPRAVQISLAVSLSFLVAASLGGVVFVAVLEGKPQGFVGIGLALAVIGLCLLRPRVMGFRWPNLFAMLGMAGLAAVDVAGAGGALWCLLPVNVSLAQFAPAFLLALGAGLVSGTPAGLGAFELVMLAHLPALGAEPLLAAIMAWRLAYFALPSVLALHALASGPRTARLCPVVPEPAQKRLWPEAGLQQQGALCGLGASGWTVGRTGHALVAFGPVAHPKAALGQLRQIAQAELRLPVLYKAPARTALAARRAGLSVALIGREAWLHPPQFVLATPARAGLRRKLRHAEKAGVIVGHDPDPAMAVLGQIAANWAARHGRERGFSMGRFCPAYLRNQRVYVARQGGQTIAFASFHAGPDAWVLDLMRAGARVPDGTMHALVLCALQDAARMSVPGLGLAAVPLGAFADAPGLARLVAKLARAKGLMQFKAAFAPDWKPLYLAAPTRAGLALAALSISRAVHWPGPLRPLPPHDDLAGNGFA